jgi:hypothetical protein
MDTIKISGLYDRITEIRCCVLGDNNEPDLFNDPKIIIRGMEKNIYLYEAYTINCLLQDAEKDNFNVLYIHTKGITRDPLNKPISDWINYLCYFNIFQYKKCIELLDKYDTVGVNLTKDPPIHYSGNFWWSTSNYIKKLDPCIMIYYNSPEFWLTEKNIGKYNSLWNSNINHYDEEYPVHLYKALE